ncbi:MAG: hypothetical protein ACUVQM_05100 [Candidatus Hadarchaeaceae archaeon]
MVDLFFRNGIIFPPPEIIGGKISIENGKTRQIDVCCLSKWNRDRCER